MMVSRSQSILSLVSAPGSPTRVFVLSSGTERVSEMGASVSFGLTSSFSLSLHPASMISDSITNMYFVI